LPIIGLLSTPRPEVIQRCPHKSELHDTRLKDERAAPRIKTVYRSSSDTGSTEQNIDEEPHKRLVAQAYQLLDSWHLLPGMRDGIVDAAKLEACVAEVRRQAAEAGRIRPCDACVGKILIRGLLEIGSRSVNFATFLFYSRIFRVPKWALIQQS
jgi:hypothetical protein